MPAMIKSIRRARSNTASYYADNIKSSLHGHRRGRSFGSISNRLRMGEKRRDSGVIDNSSSSKSIDTSTTKTVNESSEYTPLALLQVTTNDDTSSETASEDDASAENQTKSTPTTNNIKTTDDNADEDLNIHVLSFNPSDDTYDVVMSLPLSDSMKETELAKKEEKETFQPTLASPDEELKRALSLQISIDVEDVKIEEEPEPEPEHTILYHKPLSRVELGDINLTEDDDTLSHASFEVARETLQENFVAAEVSRIQTKLEEVVEDTLTGMSDIVLSCGLCLDEEEALEDDDDHTADTICSSVESSYVESTLYQSTLCETDKEDGNESAASTTASFVVDYTPEKGVVVRQQEEVASTPQSNDEDNALSICTEQGDDVVSLRSSARHAGMETTCSKREEELQMLKDDILRHHDLGSILSEYSV